MIGVGICFYLTTQLVTIHFGHHNVAHHHIGQYAGNGIPGSLTAIKRFHVEGG